jgi:hypothetical protein
MAVGSPQFLPVAPPRIIEDVFTSEQHQRMLGVIESNGPWPLILAQYFTSPEEVIAITSGSAPEGLKPTWDMFMNPVFRGFFTQNGVCFYPELDDCFYNKKFLDLARSYWNTPYVEVDQLFFNIQGPTSAGGAPHTDGTHFRPRRRRSFPGTTRAPWVAVSTIGPTARRRIRSCFPHGCGGAASSSKMMMYHQAQGCGPVEMRKPQGLEITSTMSPDPE